MRPGLLLIADSRWPTGGHAHSGGVESSVARGEVRTPDDVARYLAARVPTTGLVTAAVAVAAATVAGRSVDWAPWDAAVSARTPSAALREVSRAQGRAMLRTVRTTWSAERVQALGGDGLGSTGRPHQALVLGVATRLAGGAAADAAALAVHHLVGQVCSAAVRLLGLDPLAMSGVHARVLEEAGSVVDDAVAAGAAAAAEEDPGRLPTASTPLPEVLAVLHARAEGALFAS